MKIKTSEGVANRLTELQEGVGNGDYCEGDLSEFLGQAWVALDDDVIEAIAFFRHLKNHKEVKESPVFPNEVMCKICGNFGRNIAIDEPLSELNDKTNGDETNG